MPPPLPLRLLSTLALLTGTWAARGALAEPGGALVGGVALVSALWALWPSARLAAFDEAARARRRAARAARARLGIEAEDAGLLELTLNHPSRVMVLKQLNAPHIIARAINPIHARILRLVGAHEVINPEQSYGERLALRLMWRGALNILPLGGGLVLTELVAPEGMLGRTLAELELPRRFSVTVAALRERGAPAAPGEALSPAAAAQLPARLPEPHRPLQRGDVLLLVGAEPHTRLLVERFQ